MQVSIEEAENILSELCQLAQEGLEVTITKDGQPYMKLVACEGIKRAESKKTPSRAELRDSLPPGTFELLPGWDESLASILES